MFESPNQNVVDFSDTQIAFASKTDVDLRRMAWLFRMMNNRWLVQLGSFIGLKAVKWNVPLSKKIIEDTIYKQFCGGTTLLECQSVIDALYRIQTATILDYGVEGKSTEDDFNRTMSETLKAIDFAASNSSVPMVSCKVTGIGRSALLAKVQAGQQLSPDEETELSLIRDRLNQICEHARIRKTGVMVDAEESWIQDVIDDMVEQMMELHNVERPSVLNTYQLYRKYKLEDLHRAYERARAKGYFLGAKLVRGAYMEKERARAGEHGYPSPIQDTKKDTDKDYNEALSFCVEHYEHIGSVNATHNIHSCQLQADWIADKAIPNNHPRLNFCQLYGMSDYITFNLANAGYNVAKYVPYGPVDEIMPYLIRRAEENTSITGEMSRELKLVDRELKRRRIKK